MKISIKEYMIKIERTNKFRETTIEATEKRREITDSQYNNNIEKGMKKLQNK